MLQTNKPEQIQVFFEIAMSIGSSLDLKKMLKSSILVYLRKLNCSSGAVLQNVAIDESHSTFQKVISIPYKTPFSIEFAAINNMVNGDIHKSDFSELMAKLPYKHTCESGTHTYLMQLPNFGLLCFKKNGDEFPEDILLTLSSINEKLAHACIACNRNSDLIIAKEKAVESDKLKTNFIRNISHEIRTPLNAIIGYSTLIADNLITPKTLPTACKSIVIGSNNLLALMDNLLDVSMLQSGSVVLKYSLIDINHFLNDLRSVFYKHLKIEQKEQLNMRVVTPLDSFSMVCDIVRLKQIFDNLISNAVRFTNKGGIEIGYLANADDKDSNQVITFYVKDSGIGVQKKMSDEAFGVFNRIDNTEKIYSGTGIGLTICKQLAELLNGKIWIESEEDKGTCVFFMLPTDKTIDELTRRL